MTALRGQVAFRRACATMRFHCAKRAFPRETRAAPGPRGRPEYKTGTLRQGERGAQTSAAGRSIVAVVTRSDDTNRSLRVTTTRIEITSDTEKRLTQLNIKEILLIIQLTPFPAGPGGETVQAPITHRLYGRTIKSTVNFRRRAEALRAVRLPEDHSRGRGRRARHDPGQHLFLRQEQE